MHKHIAIESLVIYVKVLIVMFVLCLVVIIISYLRIFMFYTRHMPVYGIILFHINKFWVFCMNAINGHKQQCNTLYSMGTKLQTTDRLPPTKLLKNNNIYPCRRTWADAKYYLNNDWTRCICSFCISFFLNSGRNNLTIIRTVARFCGIKSKTVNCRQTRIYIHQCLFSNYPSNKVDLPFWHCIIELLVSRSQNKE